MTDNDNGAIQHDIRKLAGDRQEPWQLEVRHHGKLHARLCYGTRRKAEMALDGIKDDIRFGTHHDNQQMMRR